MKNHIFKIFLIFAAVVGVTFFVLNYLFFSSSTSRQSKATGETMTLSFNPATVNLSTDGEETTTTIKVKPSAVMTVRGYAFTVGFDKAKIEIKDIEYKMGTVSIDLGQTNANLTKINTDGVILVRGEDTTAAGKAFANTTDFVDVVKIKFARKVAGGSNLSIDKNGVRFFMITPATGALTALLGSQNALLTINGGGPTSTPVPTGTGNSTLKLKVKFQGILKKRPTDALNSMNIRFKLRDEDTDTVSGYKTAAFSDSDNDNGIWSGNVSFDIIANHKYTVYVKGPYHVQKKVCVATPTETAAGTYQCSKGSIALKTGDNVLDFSGILLLVGDLPEQDGTISSYDTSLVRNNLGKKTPETVALADVNRDGVVDTQDHSGIIAALSVKNDEQ